MHHNPKLSSNLQGKRHTMVQLYETYQSSQLVPELVAQGDLLEHINAALDHLCHPGLEEKEVLGLFWQLGPEGREHPAG
ncbi:PREDICTED: testis-specific serine/threonine-protein kinase 5-like [Cercocebus atys]|uniref:testis-specific serine/threonine-protein kinase 5-like n=1 Tax=Cercocebus atys TaxID=9531 RepID=UPI0005F381B2|nr:PREDICTED: testis-specific serine/threonine-protein kinase 5-like [Cercocebus atys]